jgi:hypothetical protein
MSLSRNPQKPDQDITPPSSFAESPLTPPPSDEKKPSTVVTRVIALFRQIRDGKHWRLGPWTEFQLAQGDYDKLTSQLREDEDLLGFVENKIRCVCERDGQLSANSGDWQV